MRQVRLTWNATSLLPSSQTVKARRSPSGSRPTLVSKWESATISGDLGATLPASPWPQDRESSCFRACGAGKRSLHDPAMRVVFHRLRPEVVIEYLLYRPWEGLWKCRER